MTGTFKRALVILAVLIVVATTITGCDRTKGYKLSISCMPAEAGSVRRFNSWDTLHKSYVEGEVVKLEAYGGSGSTCYEFERWSGCVSSNSTVVSITMDSDKAIVAHFRKALSGKVWTSDGAYIADALGRAVILLNNPSATNPTYAELLTFLKEDQTESHSYTIVYVCADFARTLHNNAEKAGIRAGYVLCTDHAMNVFETTDKGLVYIDATGFEWSSDGIDKLATIGPDNRVTVTPLWPVDQAKYTSVDFPEAVYFETIVWWGGLSAECQE
jgi:hypothetical protein